MFMIKGIDDRMMTSVNKDTRAGFATLIGAPNAGKSTLMNKLAHFSQHEDRDIKTNFTKHFKAGQSTGTLTV